MCGVSQPNCLNLCWIISHMKSNAQCFTWGWCCCGLAFLRAYKEQRLEAGVIRRAVCTGPGL